MWGIAVAAGIYQTKEESSSAREAREGGRHADSALPSLILVDINSAQRLMLQYNWNGKGWKGGLRTTNLVISSQPIIPLVGFKKPSLPELVMPGIPDQANHRRESFVVEIYSNFAKYCFQHTETPMFICIILWTPTLDHFLQN